jgi:hypothetical protein
MRRETVSSSAVFGVGYDRATRTLEIEFRSGRLYRYHDVGPDVFEQLMSAPSKGRFMNARIRNEFRFTRIG